MFAGLVPIQRRHRGEPGTDGALRNLSRSVRVEPVLGQVPANSPKTHFSYTREIVTQEVRRGLRLWVVHDFASRENGGSLDVVRRRATRPATAARVLVAVQFLQQLSRALYKQRPEPHCGPL